ncbi:uncharacterized protein LOC118183328 isoform X2 [Stegodyphus dumicola]|uniref:uncharacterized protein LOC118183328 isoform X2 n=1 Tax=Stegodyphus dumicola TaxID=202533 RepID=UPI0015AB97CF|nr:uncharacterized protein LOC118183328 isoform X2 [Stegodyphus dumicola]
MSLSGSIIRLMTFNWPSSRQKTVTLFRFAHALSKPKVEPYIENTSTIQRLPYTEALKEKEIQIAVCGQLYHKWRKERRYWSVPKGDVEFKVKYIDTGHQERPRSESPIVVALHGSPGSYKNFDAIISHLYRLGVRVISPILPTLDVKNPTRFRHTPEEKSEYVKGFLKALRVPRVMKPYWLTHSLIRIYEFPVGHQITTFLAKRMIQKRQLKEGNFGEHFLGSLTMCHSSVPKQAVHFKNLLDRNFPIMLAFSENDKLIAKASSYRMAKMMMDENDVQRYDKDGKLDRAGGTNPFRKAIAFENGSHYIFKKYPDIISEAIATFLFQHFDNHMH